MSLADKLIGKPVTPEPPEIKRKKKYQICCQDRPSRTDFGCGHSKMYCVPDCELTLDLNGLTAEEMRGLEAKFKEILVAEGFELR